ncbi:hypothetical protein BABINDRAFT_163507 [Babjeviella inositovora NRRL Y-12698]|uniref:Uncharacterized protein n=1 Tax=Babjeviella inositovora NRRL Y-12698 TaxID=984486 RepID=A0A1E3QIR5_9ASCO|nr:uncharacterized protein BABINDRAFT_163507 [Babjeviella inositovora NRRL Y-12698]ODQ77498.1 hypothetical protein BABINDRAFT_163507 [Babjeviella inositovora NRRL Y-12698]
MGYPETRVARLFTIIPCQCTDDFDHGTTARMILIMAPLLRAQGLAPYASPSAPKVYSQLPI